MSGRDSGFCGYEVGYSECSCFWGTSPARLVLQAIDLTPNAPNRRAMDLGCGEGKNAIALSNAGFQVLGVELAEDALNNAAKMYPASRVIWLKADITKILGPADSFDIVIATGSLHCLPARDSILKTIGAMQMLTVPGGLNVLSAFNSGPQDLRGHDPAFIPTLVEHSSYIESYRGWEIMEASDVTQDDIHPNNGILHSHTITRILARKPV